ncbi:Uncharacterised protein [Escherichia coli]|nr:Uncharacterised protein [Escherichia coli]
MAQPLSNPTDVNSENQCTGLYAAAVSRTSCVYHSGRVVAVEEGFIEARPMVMGVAADGPR